MQIPKPLQDTDEFYAVVQSGDPLKDYYDEDELAEAIVYLLEANLFAMMMDAVPKLDDTTEHIGIKLFSDGSGHIRAYTGMGTEIHQEDFNGEDNFRGALKAMKGRFNA